GVPVEAGEEPAVGGQGDDVRLARLQLDSFEAEQAQALVAGGLGEVELRDVGAWTVAGVRDGEGGRDGVALVDNEVAVVEGRVAEAVAEGVERLRIGLGEPAIADLRPLVVLDRGRRTPDRAHPGQFRPRRLVEVSRERNRQSAGRVYGARQQLGNRL